MKNDRVYYINNIIRGIAIYIYIYKTRGWASYYHRTTERLFPPFLLIVSGRSLRLARVPGVIHHRFDAIRRLPHHVGYFIRQMIQRRDVRRQPLVDGVPAAVLLIASLLLVLQLLLKEYGVLDELQSVLEALPGTVHSTNSADRVLHVVTPAHQLLLQR